MSDFDQRYLLARYPTGGVVVDLESGNYFRVNASAALVCEAMRTGGDIEGRIAERLGLTRPQADKILGEVASGLRTPQVRRTPQGSYHFFQEERGYVLKHGERVVLEVDGAEAGIRLPPGTEVPAEAQLELYVRALAPKLLFQRGVTVLHASACVVHGRLIAFAGVSGAGKTTTVRAFADAGATLVAEDLVVLLPEMPRPEVFVHAERFIDGWARKTTSHLLRSRAAISYAELAGAISGKRTGLDAIVLLDKSRRSGTALEIRLLDRPEALSALLMHDFLGAADPETWRRFFGAAVQITGATEISGATTPDGIEHLPGAVQAYIAKYAS